MNGVVVALDDLDVGGPIVASELLRIGPGVYADAKQRPRAFACECGNIV